MPPLTSPRDATGSPMSDWGAPTAATGGEAATRGGGGPGAGGKGTAFREGSPRDEARGARAFSSLALIVSMVTITSPAIRTAAPTVNVLPSPACRIRGSRLLLCNPLPSRPAEEEGGAVLAITN